MSTHSDFVDFSQDTLKYAALSIAFNPIFWNIVARAGNFLSLQHPKCSNLAGTF
jgi:hypothetical protein